MSSYSPVQRPDASERAPSADDQFAAINAVIDETVALFHRLRAVAELVHEQGELSAGRRGILRSLDRLGAQTVPQMARARPVSRQHIQGLVNQLADEGLVEFSDNAAHKRSHLVRLTPKGKALVEHMNALEAQLFSEWQLDLPPARLFETAATLHTVREALEREHYQLQKKAEAAASGAAEGTTL